MQGAIGKNMKTADQPAEDKVDSKHPENPESQGDAEKVSPEEQQNYENAVLAGVQIIFDDQSNEGIVKMLQSYAEDPADAIAKTTIFVLQQLEEKSNNQLPETIIMDLADELGGNLAELAKAQNIFQVDENTLGIAAQHIDGMLGDMYGAEPGDIEEMTAGMSEEEMQGIVQQQAGFHGGSA